MRDLLFNSSYLSDFSKKTQDETLEIINKHKTNPSYNNTLDLTSHNTYSIDDPNTKEVDDSISIVNAGSDEWIWIHIADTTHFIAPDSALDIEAANRGTSIYLAEGCRFMLPEVLFQECINLIPGRINPALSIGVVLNNDGSINKYNISQSLIRPKYRLSYEEADELIELAPKEEMDLMLLSEKLKLRKNWRKNQGCLDIVQTHGKIKAYKNNISYKLLNQTASRALISEAMILFGTIIAKFAIEKNISIPFRGQSESAKLPVIDDSNLPIVFRNYQLRYSLNRSFYSAKPHQHYALALSAYVQATSPIRRYSDLLVQRQIVNYMNRKKLMDINQMQLSIDKFERIFKEASVYMKSDDRYNLLRLINENKSIKHSITLLAWLKKGNSSACVFLNDYCMETYVTLKAKATIREGNTLNVSIISIDIDLDELVLGII